MSRMGMLINLVFITVSNGFKWKDSTHLASAVCWPKQDLLTLLNLGHEPISRAISSNLILQDPVKIELGGAGKPQQYQPVGGGETTEGSAQRSKKRIQNCPLLVGWHNRFHIPSLKRFQNGITACSFYRNPSAVFQRRIYPSCHK